MATTKKLSFLDSPLTLWLFIAVIPPFLGFKIAIMDISIGTIAENVAIYLGIPFLLGILSRLILVKLKGEELYT